MLSKDNKILIVGLGLIGGSYAEGLTKADPTQAVQKARTELNKF